MSIYLSQKYWGPAWKQNLKGIEKNAPENDSFAVHFMHLESKEKNMKSTGG